MSHFLTNFSKCLKTIRVPRMKFFYPSIEFSKNLPIRCLQKTVRAHYSRLKIKFLLRVYNSAVRVAGEVALLIKSSARLFTIQFIILSAFYTNPLRQTIDKSAILSWLMIRKSTPRSHYQYLYYRYTVFFSFFDFLFFILSVFLFLFFSSSFYLFFTLELQSRKYIILYSRRRYRMNSDRYRYYIFQFEEPKLGHLRSEAESVSSTRMNISSCVSWSRKIAAKDKDEERFRSQKLEPLQKSYRNWWQAFSSFSYTNVRVRVYVVAKPIYREFLSRWNRIRSSLYCSHAVERQREREGRGTRRGNCIENCTKKTGRCFFPCFGETRLRRRFYGYFPNENIYTRFPHAIFQQIFDKELLIILI